MDKTLSLLKSNLILKTQHVDLDVQITSSDQHYDTRRPSASANQTGSRGVLLHQLEIVLDTMDTNMRVPPHTNKGTVMMTGVEHLRPSLTTLQLISANNASVLLRSDAVRIWKCSCRWVTHFAEGDCRFVAVDCMTSCRSDFHFCACLIQVRLQCHPCC